MFITDKEIIAIANERGIEFDAFLSNQFCQKKENGSIDDLDVKSKKVYSEK